MKLLILLFGLLIVASCTTMGEAGKVLRNDKTSSDEFLIKKKEPLTQPPGFGKIPEPRSIEKQAEQSSIENILKVRKKESASDQIKSSSTEESILKRIK